MSPPPPPSIADCLRCSSWLGVARRFFVAALAIALVAPLLVVAYGGVVVPAPVVAQTPPVISITAGTSPVIEGTAASFTVTASLMPSANLVVTVRVADASNGGDFVVSGGEGDKTVTIRAGETSAMLSVATTDDTTDEPNGAVSATVQSGSGYTVDSSASTASVNIADNDATEVSLVGRHGYVVEGSRVDFDVMLSRVLVATEVLPVKLSLDSFADAIATRGADFSLSCASATGVACTNLISGVPTVTFTGGSSAAQKATVTVTAVDDGTAEVPGEVVVYELTGLSSSVGTNLGGGATPIVGTQRDLNSGVTTSRFYSVGIVDSPSVSVSPANVGSADLDGAVLTVTPKFASFWAADGGVSTYFDSSDDSGLTVAGKALFTLEGAPTGLSISDVRLLGEVGGTAALGWPSTSKHISAQVTLAYTGADLTANDTVTVKVGPAAASNNDVRGLLKVAYTDDADALAEHGYTAALTTDFTVTPTPGAVQFAADGYVVSEETGKRSAAVTLNVTQAPTSDVTVSYTVDAAKTSATSAIDYTALSGTATITAGTTSATIAVAALDDNADEPAETITLTLDGGTGYTLGDRTTTTITITDDDATTVTLTATAGDVAEDSGTKDFTVTLGRELVADEVVTVPLTVTGASVVEDFVWELVPVIENGVPKTIGDPENPKLVFPTGVELSSQRTSTPVLRFTAGAMSATIRFTPVDNKRRTQPYVTVAYGTGGAAPTGTNLDIETTGGPVEFVITDDETGTIWVPADWPLKPSSLSSGDTFRLVFTTSTTRDATSTNIGVYDDFVQSHAADGLASLTPYAGFFRVVGSTSSVDAHNHNDANTSSDGTGEAIYWLDADKVADDYADFWDADWDDETTPTTESGVVVTPSAQGYWTGTTTGGVASSNLELGSSGQVAVGGLNAIPSGVSPTSGLQGPRGRDLPLYGLSMPFTVGVNVALSVNNKGVVAEGATLTLTAMLPSPAPAEVVIPVRRSSLCVCDNPASNADYELSASSITVASGQTTGTVTLSATDDDLPELTEQLVLGFGSLPAGYLAGSPVSVTVAISDDDDAVALSVVVDPDSFGRLQHVSEAGGAKTVRVVATVVGGGPFDADKTVAVTVGDSADSAEEGTDYETVGALSVIIPAGQLSGFVDFVLTPTADGEAEKNESLTISGTSANTDVGVMLGEQFFVFNRVYSYVEDGVSRTHKSRGVHLHIVDSSDTVTRLVLSFDADADTAGVQRFVREGGRAKKVTVTASIDGAARFTQDVSFELVVGKAGDTAIEGTDYAEVVDKMPTIVDGETVLKGVNIITINANQTSGSATFTLTPTNDSIDEPVERLSVYLIIPTSQPGEFGFISDAVSLPIFDDDGKVSVRMVAAAGDINENGGSKDVVVVLERPLTGSETVTVPLTVTGVTVTDDFTWALQPSSQTGVSLLTANPHSAQSPALRLAAGASQAVLRFTAVNNDKRTQPYVTVNYGTGARAPSGTNVTIDTPSGGPLGFAILDDETGAVEVPANWALKPSTVSAGGKFRLLFTTSGSRDATSADIGVYDGFVRSHAATGHASLVPYAGFFRAVASTPAVDADAHNEADVSVDGTGEAIYWLDGDKAADNYSDFWDNSWDDEKSPTDENGTAANLSAPKDANTPNNTQNYWTGTGTDGNRRSGFELGKLLAGTGELGELVDEKNKKVPVLASLSSSFSPADGTLPLYALSQPFTVEATAVKPTVQFAAATYTATEASANRTVTVTINASPAPSTNLTVNYSATGTATPSSDFTTLSGTATIAANASSTTFDVVVSDDNIDDDGETIIVTLTADNAYTIGTTNTTTITITDDDATPTGITLTVDADTSANGNQGAVSEGGGAKTVQITATVNGSTRFATAQTVTVTVGASRDSATEGTDYANVAQQTITIAAGAASGSVTFTLTPDDDSTDEPTEQLSISGTLGALSVAGKTIRITDNDPTTVTLAREAGGVTEGNTLDYTLTLGRALVDGEALAVPVTIRGSATRKADFTVACESPLPAGVVCAGFGTAKATVTFTGGGGAAQSVKFTLSAIADDVAEPSGETVNIQLGALDGDSGTNLDGGAASINNAAVLTISDPGVGVAVQLSVSGSTVVEGEKLTITATLAEPAPVGGVQIPVGVRAGGKAQASDYRFAGTITIAEGQTFGTLELTATDDSAGEGDETLTLELGNLPAGYMAGSRASAKIIIADDDPVELTDDSGVTVTVEGGVLTMLERATRENRTGNRDSFTVTLAAGQSKSVVLVPSVDLKLTVAGVEQPFVTVPTLTFFASENAQTLTQYVTANRYDTADVAGGTHNGTITWKVVEYDATYRGTDPGKDLTEVTSLVVPSIPFRVIDDDPTSVELLQASTVDSVATEADTADTATLRLKLGRALVAGETLIVPLKAAGATLGTNFSLAAAGNGVTYAVAQGLGEVTFTGPSAAEATITISASDDSDTISEQLTLSIADRSDVATPKAGDGFMRSVGLAGGACSGTCAGIRSGGSTLATSQQVLLVDDDIGVRLTLSGDAEVAENGGTLTYDVRLAVAPVANETVTVAVSSGTTSALTVTTGSSLTFDASDWSTAKQVTVTGVNSAGDAADRLVNVTHAVSSSGGTSPVYASGVAARVLSVRVIDDDATTVTVSGGGTVTEGDASTSAAVSVSLGRALVANEVVQVPLLVVSPTGAPLVTGRRFLPDLLPQTAMLDWAVTGTGTTVDVDPFVRASRYGNQVRLIVTLSGKGAQRATLTFTPAASVIDADPNDERVEVRLDGSELNNDSRPTNVTGGVTGSGTRVVTITDTAPSAITLSVDADTSTKDVQEGSIPEGAGAKTVQVTATIDDSIRLDRDLTVTVTVGASSDSATEGTDYERVADQKITITAGSLSGSVTFVVVPKKDANDEPAELISVIGEPVGNLTFTGATIRLVDSDPTRVSLTREAGTSLVEGSSLDYTLTLGRALVTNESLMVPLRTSGTSRLNDYTLACENPLPSGVTCADLGTRQPSVTFTGSDSAAKEVTLTLTATADTTLETGGETVDIGLGTLNSSSGTNLDGGARGRDRAGAVTIRDKVVVPELSITADSSSVVEGGTATFTITAKPAPTSVLRVYVSVADATGGGDYLPAASEGGNKLVVVGTDGTGTYRLDTLGDRIDEPNGTVTVTLQTRAGYTVDSSANTASVKVIDNLPTVVTLSRAAGSTLVEGSSLVYTLTLSRALVTDETLAVPLTFSRGTGTATRNTDYTLACASATGVTCANLNVGAATVTFTGSDSAARSVTITLTTATDSTAEPSGETVDVGLGTLNASSGTNLGGGARGRDRAAAVTINDPAADDVPVTLTVNNSGSVTEGGTLTVTATLESAAPSGGVTIPVRATLNGSAVANDFTLSNDGDITITAGNTAGTLTFTATDDNIDENAETLTLGFGTLPDGYRAGTPSSAEVTITDNDDAPTAITLSVDADTSANGVQGAISEGGGAKTVRVTATINGNTRFATTQTVTVTVGASSDTATEGTDYTTVADQTITIAAGAASGSVMFTLTPDDDSTDEPEEFLSISGTSGSLTFTGTSIRITDDDATTVTLLSPEGALNVLRHTQGRLNSTVLNFALSRALVSGESLKVPVVFSGATLGESFTVMASQLPGVTFGDFSDADESFVMFTGGVSASQLAFVFVTYKEDSNEVDETLVVSVPATSVSGSPKLTATGFAEAVTGSGSVSLTLDDPANNEEISVRLRGGGVIDGSISSGDNSQTNVVVELSRALAAGELATVVVNFDDKETFPSGALLVGPKGTNDVMLYFRVAVSGEGVTSGIRDDGYELKFRGSDTDTVQRATLTFTSTAQEAGTSPQHVEDDADHEQVEVTFEPDALGWVESQGLLLVPYDDEDPATRDDATTRVLITDDDATAWQVSFTDTDDKALSTASVTEGDDYTFKVALPDGVTGPVTIPLTYTHGTGSSAAEFDPLPASVTVPFGQSSATVTVSTVEDQTTESAETLTVTPGAAPPGFTTSGTSLTLTVTDDDVSSADPVISIAADTSPVTEGTAATFTVTADPAPTSNLVVTVAVADASNGADYVTTADESNQTVTINANQTTAKLTVNTTVDSTDEPNGTVTATVQTGTGYTVSSSANAASVNVTDNDATTVTLARDAGATLSESGTLDYTLTLGRALVSGEVLAVPLTFASGTGVATRGTDYMLACESPLPMGVTCANLNSGTATVTFTGSATAAKTVTITLSATTDDNVESEGETVDINLGTLNANSGTNLDGGASGIDTAVVVRIVDPGSTAGVIVSGVSALSVKEDGSDTDSFTVVLGAAVRCVEVFADLCVGVNVTVSDKSVLRVSHQAGGPFGFSTQLVFGDNNWGTPQTVYVRGVDDSKVNQSGRTGQLVFDVVAFDVGAFDENVAFTYDKVAVPAVSVTVTDDNRDGSVAVFNKLPSDLMIAENSDGSTTPIPVGSPVTAVDVDGDSVTYSLADSPSPSDFSINASSGQISYTGSGLDYEALYSHRQVRLVVVASSAGPDSSTQVAVSQPVAVNVTNVNEGGAKVMVNGFALAGRTTMSFGSLDGDPDGDPNVQETDTTGLTFLWQTSTDNGANWVTATGTGSGTATYQVATVDAGRLLRLQVSYTDFAKHKETVHSQPVTVSGITREQVLVRVRDGVATENNTADKAVIAVGVDLALLDGEKVTVQLNFTGGTAGTDFMLTKTSDSPANVTVSTTGLLTFVGPVKGWALVEVTAPTDKDTENENITISIGEITATGPALTNTKMVGTIIGTKTLQLTEPS